MKVVRAKYSCGSDLVPRIRLEKTGSNLWKGICQSWESVEKNLVWRIGNGRSVNCWEDVWLPSLGRMSNVFLRHPNIVEANYRVCDIIDE